MLRETGRKLMLLLGALALAACVHLVWAASDTGSIQGVVKDSSGDPVTGAFVKLRNADRRLVFMVVSHEQGRYSINNLPPGQYVVQGIGGARQSELSAPVKLEAGAKENVDVALTGWRALGLLHAWPGMPPGQEGGEDEAGQVVTLPEGAGKEIVAVKCQQCHDASRIVSNHTDKDHWQGIVEVMNSYMQGSLQAKPLTGDESKTVVDYLATNFGGARAGHKAKPAPDPNSRLPWQLQKGDEANYVTVEFTLPDPKAEPHEVAVDTDGNAWVSQRTAGHLGRLDPRTFLYTEIDPPPGASKNRLNGIIRGQDNRLWFIDGGPNRRWLSYDTKTKEFTVYELPKLKGGAASGNTMRMLPDGSVWLCSIEANEVIKLDPKTKEFTVYEVPSGVKAGKTANPYGMAISGDSKVWFVENAMNKLGRVDPKTGQIDEFDVPLANSVPRKMGMDSQGNIWVGLHGAGKLMKVDYETTAMTIYTPPTENAGVYSVQGDPKSRLIWMSEQQADKIARFDPTTQTFTEFALPDAEEDHRRIDIDPTNPNRIWWSGDSSGRMGYIELLGHSTSARSGN